MALTLRAPFSRFIKRMNRSTMILSNAVVNTVALSAAGIVNAVIMRETELKNGINVYDDEGNVRGRSKECAKIAV